LYRTVDAFRLLRESRARLLDPGTFEEEATALLQPLLGAATERLRRAPAPGTVVDDLVTRLVQPHIVRGADPSLPTYSPRWTRRAGLMRRILHEPRFQALEALWRGVRRLVETLELGDEVTLTLLDVRRRNCSADL
jgi:type VI secretion system protein ImpC